MCFFGGGSGGLKTIVDPVGAVTKKLPAPLRPPTPLNPAPVTKSIAGKLLGD